MDQNTYDGDIVIQGVRHVYKGNTVALNGIDLRIGKGLFGMLGPNGAGKSTLMRIICTLLVPTEGKVTVGGHDVVLEVTAVKTYRSGMPIEPVTIERVRIFRVGNPEPLVEPVRYWPQRVPLALRDGVTEK